MPEQCSCEEINRKLDQVIEQTKNISAAKGKRLPSDWQKHLKICLPQKTGTFQEKMAACKEEYHKGKR